MRYLTCIIVIFNALSLQAKEPELTMIFCGDIMLADNPGREIERGVDPFAEFEPLFREADFVFGNLECVIATKGQPVEKPWTFRAHPRTVPLLKKHFDAMTVANNHTGDFGREAFAEMLELCAGEVPLFGGGRNKREACKPLILEKNGLKLALLGYNGFKPRTFEATENGAGCAWLAEEEMLTDIAAVKREKNPDLLIPFLHWGREGDRQPQEYQREMAHKLCTAGATAVVGAHPHVTQTIEYFDAKPVVYSLGNYVFDGFVGDADAQIGWLWRATFNRSGVVKWETIVVRLEEESGLPHLDWKTASPSGHAGSTEIEDKPATPPTVDGGQLSD